MNNEGSAGNTGSDASRLESNDAESKPPNNGSEMAMETGIEKPVPNADGNGAKANAASGSGNGGENGQNGGDDGKGNGAASKTAGAKGRSLVKIAEVEPWPERVNLAEVLDEIVRQLQRFVIFPKWAAETLALWVVHTFAYELRDVATYIGIESPEKECGKSTLITLLSLLVNRPAVSSNISPSAFFRVIEELKPTLLIDEADTNLRGKDDLMGILNSSYTRATGFVWRISYDPIQEPGEGPERGETSSAGHVAVYSSWCPKAIAAIGHLHPTLASRCIVIRMQRKTAREECERLKRLDATELKRKCARFVADNAEAIRRADPGMPKDLANRAADVWEPLLVLADLAGGHWPKLAREAALGLTARAQDNSPIGSLLLDIYLAFIYAKVDRMFSRDLVRELSGYTDRPWVELRRGKALTETWLAQQLRPYGVKPTTIRIGENLGKGYVQEEMLETFRRYIPKAELEAFMAEMRERRAQAGMPSAEGDKKPEGGGGESGKQPGESGGAT